MVLKQEKEASCVAVAVWKSMLRVLGRSLAGVAYSQLVTMALVTTEGKAVTLRCRSMLATLGSA
ncbi:hypothetical protein PC129_g23517 [Phytophthora cactorum]|uniref:Uncharacterized protein n=1 Tax=Phytophthora cactorum TaxID=29920 RepID=A0A8T0YC73_9STRA|nr:hypothetical protein PC112_g23935 [Phytophthora cactorum]KAG2792473.1 hypothetical protein PC111_g23447 [Phytophthora cactorum]KAG2810586.1 hypothetical protein PC113_g23748 [Phytophthora cactorum]KAG2872038.1 hypothetical protein PC114_g26597 [Phytophthora cactorum]KAG2876196.1 hypothetical protein PC115_g23690 [Phytophthora cactorum]